MRLELRALCLLVVLCAALSSGRASAEASSRGGKGGAVEVIVPEAANLQLLAFYAALGAGYFADEGLQVRPVAPEKTGLAEAAFQQGAAPVALLPGPAYERLIQARFPFLLAANLFANEPLDLVVRREFVDRAHLSRALPLRQRLDLLHGAAIGVTSQARARLYLLFRTQGLDANSTRITILDESEQLEALGSGQVEALYTQTPILEQAVHDKDAIVVVDSSAGDVPAFSDRMVQSLAVSRAFANGRPEDVRRLVRGVARGEHLLRGDEDAAAEAIARVLPQLNAGRLATLVSIYAHAMPATPRVEVKLLRREASFYPVGGDPLRLAGIDLASFIFDDGGASADGGDEASGSMPRRVLLSAGLLALAIALLVVIAEQRERSGELG